MKISILYFIGKCLSLDENPLFRETIIDEFSDPEYNWHNFIWTSSNHLILPAIYLKFRAHDLLQYLPSALSIHLKEIFELNQERNLQILLQMKEITATLNLAGIFPIFLKGTGNLIDEIYSEIGERIIGDIDLLVPDNQYILVVELAKKSGYINHWGNPRNPEKLKHYPRLFKKNEPAALEIHRLPVRPEYSKFLNSEMLFHEKKEVKTFPGCFVPSDNHKVIQNFIHSQLSNSGHRLGVITLRDVYDLALFSKRTDITSVLQQTACQRKAVTYLVIMQRLLGLHISEKQTITSKFFIFKHDLNLSSPLFFKINRIPWVISNLLIHGYPKKIKEALLYKDARQSLLQRLGNKKWYVQHFKLINKKFSE